MLQANKRGTFWSCLPFSLLIVTGPQTVLFRNYVNISIVIVCEYITILLNITWKSLTTWVKIKIQYKSYFSSTDRYNNYKHMCSNHYTCVFLLKTVIHSYNIKFYIMTQKTGKNPKVVHQTFCIPHQSSWSTVDYILDKVL